MTNLSLLKLFFYFTSLQPVQYATRQMTAQAPAHIGHLISEEGFWIIQQYPEKPQIAQVFFYNKRSKLIRKEWRHVKDADVSQVKTIRSLKRTLEEALDFYKEP